MEQLNGILERTYFNNTVADYLIALGIIIAGMIIINVFKKLLLKRVGRWADSTATNADNFVINKVDQFGIPALYIFIIYSGINYLHLTDKAQSYLEKGITIVITVLVIQLISTTVIVLLKTYLRQQDNAEEKIKQVSGIKVIINIIIWSVGILFLLDNMGKNVSAIITGLGIGGIAVALAAQNILGDLFNYFVIFFDRPFEIGDFLVIDDKNGVVEHIGIKTTRIKTLSGEQLVFSNSDLTKSRIHNYKRMQRRRVLFRFGVTYQTSHANLKEIPTIMKSIVLEQHPVEFDRSHFAAYGNFSLDFETVYYVLDADYTTYMNIHQAINLRMYEEFEKREIAFAYPTQTLFLNRDGEEDRQPKTELQD